MLLVMSGEGNMCVKYMAEERGRQHSEWVKMRQKLTLC